MSVATGMMHGMMVASKDLVRPLPVPMDYPSLSSALLELGVGMRKAVETCLECWKNKRLSDDDFLSFLRSIKSQSPTLNSKLGVPIPCSTYIASANDMAELRALAGLGDSYISSHHTIIPGQNMLPQFTAVTKSEPTQVPMEASRLSCLGALGQVSQSTSSVVFNAKESASQPLKSPARTRRPKNGSPTTEEQMLMEQWRTRRAAEVLRRQLESSEARTTTSYIRFMLEKLRCELPPAGRASLLEALRSFRGGRITESQLGDTVRTLVDQYSIVVRLVFTPEYKVRQPAQRKLRFDLTELDDIDGVQVNDDDGIEEPVAFQKNSSSFNRTSSAEYAPKSCPVSFDQQQTSGQVDALEQIGGLKRKRSSDAAVGGCAQRCSSGGVMLAGPAPAQAGCDEENATCPVCCGSDGIQLVEDDRWVKCDGCASWYHQICVLFNEPAHGKSVRFFCRTPGCRKRGSRQLNRRMRKPCYPTSPGLETSAVGDYLTAAASGVARQDRQVIVKTVASRSSSDGERRRRTIMAFQHTLTGSDLLFFAIFVEENRGKNHISIVDVDSNGYYEEAFLGERFQVEAAIMHALLQYSRENGFVTLRVNLSSLLAPSQGAASSSTGIYHARPHNVGWSNLPAAVSELGATFQQAVERGILASVVAPQNPRASPIFTGRFVHYEGPQLPPKNPRQVADVLEPDLPCTLAACREDLLAFFQSGIYRFDTLQSAKFSSMMLVYHLSKGWKKDLQIGRSCSSSNLTSGSTQRYGGESGDDCEEEQEKISLVQDKVDVAAEAKDQLARAQAKCRESGAGLDDSCGEASVLWCTMGNQAEFQAHIKEEEESVAPAVSVEVDRCHEEEGSAEDFPFGYIMETEEAKKKNDSEQCQSYSTLFSVSNRDSTSGAMFARVNSGHLGGGSFSGDTGAVDFMFDAASRRSSPMILSGVWSAKMPALTTNEWSPAKGSLPVQGWNSNWESSMTASTAAGGSALNTFPSSPPLEPWYSAGSDSAPSRGCLAEGLESFCGQHHSLVSAPAAQILSSTSTSSRSASRSRSSSPRCTFRGFSPVEDGVGSAIDPFWDAICTTD